MAARHSSPATNNSAVLAEILSLLPLQSKPLLSRQMNGETIRRVKWLMRRAGIAHDAPNPYGQFVGWRYTTAQSLHVRLQVEASTRHDILYRAHRVVKARADALRDALRVQLNISGNNKRLAELDARRQETLTEMRRLYADMQQPLEIMRKEGTETAALADWVIRERRHIQQMAETNGV